MNEEIKAPTEEDVAIANALWERAQQMRPALTAQASESKRKKSEDAARKLVAKPKKLGRFD